MKKTRKLYRNFRKKEPGSGGPLIYAMAFVAFVFAIYIFLMMEYRSKIHMLKDDMETRTHVVENYCITVNQRESGGEDLFERERERAHIVTVGVADPSASIGDRKAQAMRIGQAFSEQFREQMELDGCKPKGGPLSMMTNRMAENAEAEMHIVSAVIYEPTYERGDVFPVYCGNNLHDHENACKSPSTCPLPANFSSLPETERKRWTEDGTATGRRIPTSFWTITNTTGWYVYDLKFDSNNMLTDVLVSQSPTAPEVMGNVFGIQQYAEGATIQATIEAKFKRPFGFWGEDLNDATVNGGFVVVRVSEGIDIVYSTDDSRNESALPPTVH